MQRNCVVLICLCCSGHTTLVENSSVVRVCTVVHPQPQRGVTCKDVWSVLKQPFSSRLGVIHCDPRGEGREMNTAYSSQWQSRTYRLRKGLAGRWDQEGWWERPEHGGNNDMKEPRWRSHTALAHLTRCKIPWPPHTHAHTLSAHEHTRQSTHARSGQRDRRLHNKEKPVMNSTSEQKKHHHSSAYTDWPLEALSTWKTNAPQIGAGEAVPHRFV